MAGVEQSSPQDESLPLHERAVQTLIDRALKTVNDTYGPDGRDPKPYHGPEHTQMVLESAVLLANAAMARDKIIPSEKELLQIAAAYHDIVQNAGSGDNEELSAETAMRHMNMLSVFSSAEVRRVGSIIMATVVSGVFPDRIQQSPTEDYLTQLMVDADLSSLGSPPETYWPTAQIFFAETFPEIPLEGEILKQFAASQLVLVNGHRYQTEEARQLFNHQAETSDFLQSLISDPEST